MLTTIPHLRTGKTWHGSDQTVLFQISSAHGSAQLPKRFYLICDCNQKSRGFRFSLEKPEDLKTQGLAANILRKYMPSATIADIVSEGTTGDLWAIFSTSRNAEGTWFIRIDRALPPELSFISHTGDIFFRLSAAGSFSKHRQYQGRLPTTTTDPSYSSVLSMLLATMAPGSKDSEAQAVGTGDLGTPTLALFQREARDRLARRFKTVKKSVEKLRAQIPKQFNIEEEKLKAGLLQQYAYLLKTDESTLTLGPEITGLADLVSIELAEGASPGQLINDAFARVKKMQKALDIGGKRLAQDEKNLASIEGDLFKLRSQALDHAAVEVILREHHLAAEKQATFHHDTGTAPTKPYKIFQSASGAKILVGKSAAESDEMVKAARSNDYWFHVIATTGSHVIIPFKSLSGGKLPDEVKRDACILALHHSKLRTDLAGEVYFSRKQHIRKKRGMPVGLWTVDKSETIFVKYSSDELKQILEKLLI